MNVADRRPDDAGAADEIDALFGEARLLADRDADRVRVDWRAAASRARRRRIAARAAYGGAMLVLAGAAAAGWWAASTAAFGERPAERRAGVGAVPEYRLLRPAECVDVIAERAASLTSVSGSVARLVSGTVWVRVLPECLPEPFAVVTPDARVSVIGTRFAVSVAPWRGTFVAVTEGRVRVQGHDTDLEVPAGTVWRSGSRVPTRMTGGRSPSFDVFLPPVRDERGSCPGASTHGGPEPAAADPGEPALAAGDPAPAPAAAGIHAPASRPPAATEPGSVEPAPHVPAADADAPVAEAERMYREAEAALVDGRLEDAARILERVSLVARGSALGGAALMDLAARRLRLGSPERAAAAYARYLDEQPSGPLRGEARISLCRIEAGAGRDAEARRCYAAYLAEYPDGAYAGEARRWAGAAGRR